jgi:vancomycin resistance protein YoaR
VAVLAERTDAYRSGGFRRAHLVVPLLVLAALALAALGVDSAFAGRVLPRLTVAGIEVGTLAASDLRARLDVEVARPWAAAHVEVRGPDGLTWTTTNGAIAIGPDVDRAVADALSYGRTGSLIQRLAAWVEALRGRAAVPFTMRADPGTVDGWVNTIAAAVDRAAVEGQLVPTYHGVDVRPAVVGREVDRARLGAALVGPDTLDDRSIALAVHETYPALDPSGLRDAAAKAIAATTAMQITAGDRTATEDAAGLATLLVIDRTPAAPGTLEPIPAGATAPTTRYVYSVRLDEERVTAWVSRLAAVLDHPAQSATYSVQRDGSLAVVPSVTGTKIDQARLVADVMAQLFVPVAGSRQLTPSSGPDTPAFTTEQAQRYVAQMSLVSTYTTTYPASASRHANITTGALQFDDLVVAPGDSFSFWARLGPVSVERGYAYAGAIIDNRSDENVIGGGLCQVSTTLFNVVARAGYEILERHAHGYYIDRYPIGFDAAVFEPGVDFQWRNDTPYPVLIRAFPYDTALRFDLISVPTGRRVVVGDATQWNLTSPEADQPADPAYPPGAVVEGRDVARSWTVWQGDAVIHDVTFVSHYVPVWGGLAR